MSGCVCENIHHLCMREELIFLWAFQGSFFKFNSKKNMFFLKIGERGGGGGSNDVIVSDLF